MKPIRIFLVVVLAILVSSPLFGRDELTPYRLGNGLEVYVFEDDSVPLVTFQITFRTGACIETPEFDGLSHLYEHMLFKANADYNSQEEFTAALKKLGVKFWNGGTGTESVTYFATVPKSQIEGLVKFWAVTIRTNYVVEAELAKEKDVVSNEVKMYEGDAERSFGKALNKVLFEKYFSRKNIGGSVEVIQSCTAEQLKWLKDTYYIPNNAAIFISGDIDGESALMLTEKYFGDWERGADPAVEYPIPKHPGFDEDKLLVVSNFPSPMFFLWGYRWRGPDADDEMADTYPADVLTMLLSRKTGKFLTALEGHVFQKDAVQFGYSTQRNGGTLGLNIQFLVGNEPSAAPEKLAALRGVVDGEIEKMATDPDYFTPEAMKWAIEALEAELIFQEDDISAKANTVSFWWSVSSSDYYKNYLENMKKVTAADVQSLVKRYMLDNKHLEVYWIHPQTAAQMGLEGK